MGNQIPAHDASEHPAIPTLLHTDLKKGKQRYRTGNTMLLRTTKLLRMRSTSLRETSLRPSNFSILAVGQLLAGGERCLI